VAALMLLSDYERQAVAENVELQGELYRAKAKQLAILQILARLDRYGLDVDDLARHMRLDASIREPA
jgi:hypothetical protein